MTPANPQSLLPMAMATSGSEYEIQAFNGRKDFGMRMLSMGLGVGRRVRVLRCDGGQMIIACGETRLALGQGVAQKILVSKICQEGHDVHHA